MRVRCHLALWACLLPQAVIVGQTASAPVVGCATAAVAHPPAAVPLDRHLTVLAHRLEGTPDSVAPLLAGARCGHGWSLRPLRPTVRATFQDGIPDARDDGAAVTSNGLSLHARAGLEGRIGPVQVRFAPELTIEENVGFETAPGVDPARSSFASPFYAGRISADLPSRFGLSSRTAFHPGESGIWWRHRPFEVSAVTGLLRWGPAAGEGLVIGTSAPGIPRIEWALRGRRHGHAVGIRSFIGAVSESPYFDSVGVNDWRPLSGVRMEWSPREPRLRFGISRTVMDGRRQRSLMDGVSLALTNARTDSLIDFTSLDVEWIDLPGGTWGWVELARQVPIEGLRDLLRQPTEGLALRIGGSQRIAVDGTGAWYLSADFVRLDQPQQRTDRLEQDLYTSGTVVHGWTHRGQPLGSGLGPGGQRQRLGLDRRGRRFRIGGFLERVRWNDGMLYRQFLTGPFRHDVSVLGGLHLANARQPDAFTLRLSVGRRLNYLFQNDRFNPGYRTANLPLLALSLTVTP